MKTKITNSSVRISFIALLLIAFLHSGFAVDIVGYTLGSGTDGEATSGVSINFPGKGRVISQVGLTNIGYNSQGLNASGWDNNGNDGFATNAFSTVGYLNTAVVGQIKGTIVAPKFLKAQYSLNGSNWNDVPNHDAYFDDNPNLVLTTALASFKFRLPAECDNVSSVYVRWIQDGTVSVNNGTVTSGGTVSLKAVVMQADQLDAPTSQATQITLVSLTPTTITIGCTPGSGNRRYVVINSTNSFTNPTDNFLPSANAVYSGSGQQIIYAGSGTVFTVTVPSSLNTYWFRYYEYNQLDNLTRFSTVDASLSKNPKKCALPSIHTPTHSFGLINATMGATIDPVSGDVGEVVDRGVFWNTNPGVTNNSPNMVSQYSGGSGTYTVDTEVNRGSAIYYRGYAENESGINLSPESSFNNTPIFTGTGTWETPARWNVQEVPGSNGDPIYGSVEDSPIINGNCTLTTSNNVTNLRINTSQKLTIVKDVSMKVDGTLTNNAGTNGLLLKSIENKFDNAANASLIFANGNVPATVEMFSKASWNLSNPAGSKYSWQYFGVPVSPVSYNGYFAYIAFVRAWDESVQDYFNVWSKRNDGTSLQLGAADFLTPGDAYELVQETNRVYSFKGTLKNNNFTKTLQYSPAAYYPGQNMLSNPYTAAMQIADISFGANTQQAVYLYNTGTFNEWSSSAGGSTPGSGPGTYTVSTPATAGQGGVPAEIPSMQGFLVKATANPGSFSYDYNNLISNTKKQRVKTSASKVSTTIDLQGTKFSDRMWVFVDDNATAGFDNGYDGPKMVGHEDASQLYGMGTDGIYQINVVSDINDAYIAVQPGTESSFSLKFKHNNIAQKYESIYLVDLVDNVTIDVTADESVYSFTSNVNDPLKRFKLMGSKGVSTAVNKDSQSDVRLYTNDNKIIVDNKLSETGKLSIFDATGRLQAVHVIAEKTISTLHTHLTQGTYIVKMIVGEKTITQSVIIR